VGSFVSNHRVPVPLSSATEGDEHESNRSASTGIFSHVKDPARLKEIMAPAGQLLKEIRATAPETRRFLLVVGPDERNAPPASVGHAKAMDSYE
jgi:sarcosine oxidase gamma subunit